MEFKVPGITIEVPPIISRLEFLASQEYRQALKDVADLTVDEVKAQFDRKGAIATAKTVGSIKRSGVHAAGNRLIVEVAPIGDRRRAMEAIEFGRRKNKPFPPVDRILEWMEARGLTAGLTPSQQRSAAYAIARSIAEDGTAPKNIFQDTVNSPALQAKIKARIEEATRKILSTLNAGSN